MDQPTLAFGIDIGGTKVLVGLVDVFTGKVLDRRLILTRTAAGPQAVTDDIIQIIQEFKLKYFIKAPLNIGVAVAGQVEPNTGIVRFAPNLAWHNFPLREQLNQVVDGPIHLINDVRAATWGEWIYGSGRGCDDLLCLFFGTGIGGGIISAGRMLIGASNAAGELGHIVVDNKGPMCTCGNHGCFEALAGGWAIARAVKEAVQKNPSEGSFLLGKVNGNIDTLTAKHLFQGYDAKDVLSTRLFNQLAEVIIAAVSGLVNAFNPQKLIVGGGLIIGAPNLVERIHQGIVKRSLAIALEPLEVISSLLGTDAGVLGAAAYAVRTQESRKF
jgi:glucokinase